MSIGNKTQINAAECASRAGKYAFGLDEAKAVQLLRKLADDLEAGRVALFSVCTSIHATHEEFTVRELTVELLEEVPGPTAAVPGPRIIKE